MKIVVLDGFLAGFDRPGWPLDDRFDVDWYDDSTSEQVIPRIGDAQAVYTNRAAITEAVFAACPSLRFVGAFGTGYNHIDLSAANRAGVFVCNVPAYSAHAVAQSAVSLLLNIACQTAVYHGYLRAGRWPGPDDPGTVIPPMFELAGKTIGIMGYGSIGSIVADTALALGMEVLACRRQKQAAPKSPRIQFVDFDRLLALSDVVSLHCPLSEQTRGLIGQDAIARMKDGAVLINTARGGLLDERAVAKALNSGKLYMAGLDVFAEEPPAADHPLVRHPRVICTPHVSWMPLETRRRMLRIAAENLLCYIGGNPQNVVNQPTEMVTADS